MKNLLLVLLIITCCISFKIHQMNAEECSKFDNKYKQGNILFQQEKRREQDRIERDKLWAEMTAKEDAIRNAEHRKFMRDMKKRQDAMEKADFEVQTMIADIMTKSRERKAALEFLYGLR